MESQKFLFVLSHATSNPMEVIVMLKIISNMKAFDDDAEIAVFRPSGVVSHVFVNSFAI